VPASAPAAVFSAQRAYADLQQIAGREPTPIGSAGSDAIRDHLAAALAAAGFDVDVHTGVGSRTFRSTTVAGRVHNVVATWPGYDSTGQVLLAAHYDTTFGSPGGPTTSPQSRPCWRRHARWPAVSRCATTSS
jgi:acetylornithine deacetylase/succinyl-diaminopimelate desuccinylase-like protein